MLQILVWRMLERENCAEMWEFLRAQVSWRLKGALPNGGQLLLLAETRHRPVPILDSNGKRLRLTVFIKKERGGVVETRILVAEKGNYEKISREITSANY